MLENKISRVFITDDHPLFRCGLRISLEQKESIEVVGEAENGFEAVEKILGNQPDIVLIDVDMPGLSGIGAIRMLRKALPDLKILVLSHHEDDKCVRDCMAAGADGYVLKSIDVDALSPIIDCVCHGKPVFSPYLLNLSMETASDEKQNTFPFSLTVREKEVIRYISEGKGNKQIADNLFISCETVKSHIKHIFRKMNVTNRVQAVQIAMEKNILDG